MNHRNRAVLTAIAAGALAVPATASATTVRGTVVERDDAARTFVVSSATGTPTTISSTRRGVPARGARVKVSGPVRDGVLVARSIKVERARKARAAMLRGTVTAVDPATRSYTITFGQTTITVTDAEGELPAVGDIVRVAVTFQRDGDLDAGRHEDRGDDRDFDVKGTITAVDTATRSVTLQPKAGGDPIVATAAQEVDLSKLTTGSFVEAEYDRAADGTLSLTGVQAEDAEEERGDDRAERGDDRGERRGGEAGDDGERRGHGGRDS